jgi:hypothetical protein
MLSLCLCFRSIVLPVHRITGTSSYWRIMLLEHCVTGISCYWRIMLLEHHVTGTSCYWSIVLPKPTDNSFSYIGGNLFVAIERHGVGRTTLGRRAHIRGIAKHLGQRDFGLD